MDIPSSYDSCIRRAAELNNDGVSLFAFGAFGEAFKSCKAALAIMHAAPLSETHINPSEPTTVPPEMVIDSVTIPDFTETKCKICIYNRAFTFKNLDSVSMNMAFNCATITYNMALALHMHAKFTNNNLFGTKALRLYELAMSLIEEASNSDILNLECAKLRLATLNNKSEINYEHCHFEEADRMLRLMLLEFTGNSAVEGAFDENEIQELLLNLVLPNPQPAPAA